MHLARRRRLPLLAATILLATPALAAEPAGAPAPGGKPADARTHRLRAAEIDFARLANFTREVMRHELDLLLEPASLELAWRVARASEETAADELRLVLMRSRGMGGDAEALGSTSRAGPAPTIWIYLPTVAHALGLELDAVATSLEDQRLLGVSLGRVLAHEVVHLLAPDVEHADTGVMRERLHAFFLTRGRPRLEDGCLASLARGADAWLARAGPARVAAAAPRPESVADRHEPDRSDP